MQLPLLELFSKYLEHIDPAHYLLEVAQGYVLDVNHGRKQDPSLNIILHFAFVEHDCDQELTESITKETFLRSSNVLKRKNLQE